MLSSNDGYPKSGLQESLVLNWGIRRQEVVFSSCSQSLLSISLHSPLIQVGGITQLQQGTLGNAAGEAWRQACTLGLGFSGISQLFLAFLPDVSM